MRFVVDAQLPPALARWLAGQGQTTEHVLDVAMATTSDRAIWDYAIACGAVIVTKDQDFASRGAPPIVWLRCGNTRRHDLLVWFERHFATVLAALERGEVLIEIR
jgi:predicted nuclease of predicted toxin-antitoxin system